MTTHTLHDRIDAQIQRPSNVTGMRKSWDFLRPILLGIVAAAGMFTVFEMTPGADERPSVPNENPVYAIVQLVRDPSVFHFESLPRRSTEEWETYRQRQAQMVTSASNIGAAVLRLELEDCELVKQQNKPKVWLESMIDVTFTTRELMRISFKNSRSPEAARIVNAVVNVYLENVIRGEKEGRLKELDRLEKTVQLLEDNVAKKVGELHGLRDVLGIRESDDLSAQIQQQLHSEVTQSRLKVAASESNLKIAQQQFEAINEKSSPVSDLEIEAELQRDLDQLNKACQQRLAEKLVMDITQSNMPGEAEFTEHRNRLAALEKVLEIHRSQLRPGIADRLRKQKREALHQRMTQLQHELTTNKVLEDRVKKELADSASKSSIDLHLLSDELRNKQELLNLVRRKLDFVKIDLDASASVILVQPAGS